jgi:hypothetical protein
MYPDHDGLFELPMTNARAVAGANSLSISSHFPAIGYSKVVNPVMLPPGRAKLATNPPATGSDTCKNTIGMVLVASFSVANTVVVLPRIEIGLKSYQLRREGANAVRVASAPSIVHSNVAAVCPAQLTEALDKSADPNARFRF